MDFIGVIAWALRNWALVGCLALTAAVGAQSARLHWAQGELGAEREAFGKFRMEVEVAGAAQDERARAETARQEETNRRANYELRKELERARRDGDALRRRMLDDVGSGGGVVPAAPAAAGGGLGGGRVCYDRAKLGAGVRAALEGFAGAAAEVILRGDSGLIALGACAEAWRAHDERPGAGAAPGGVGGAATGSPAPRAAPGPAEPGLLPQR